MRINKSFPMPGDHGVDPPDNPKRSNRNQQAGQSGASSDAPRVDSDRQCVQDLKTALKYVPDVRQERVDKLRRDVSQGVHYVSPGQIAGAFLADF